MKPVKLLILDESMLMRESIHRELSRDVNISVVAKTANPYEARDKIIELKPDIMICDVSLEKMEGIDFVKKLLSQYYIPVIMISPDPAQKAAAESAGVKGFLVRPSGQLRVPGDFYIKLMVLVKTIMYNEQPRFSAEKLVSKLIVIGASTGGAEAIENVLKDMPPVMPPIVISQHMPPKFTNTFARRLNTVCKLSVKEAENDDIAVPGQVYIAPGGFHTTVRKRDGRYILNCAENVSGIKTCPSIDHLFNSVAPYGKGNVVGALLTGMGKDGAHGLKEMHDAGCATIGQDQHSSVIYGMPKVAFEIGAVDFQLALNKIPQKLIELSL